MSTIIGFSPATVPPEVIALWKLHNWDSLQGSSEEDDVALQRPSSITTHTPATRLPSREGSSLSVLLQREIAKP